MRVRVSRRNGPSTMHGPKWQIWRTVFIFLSPAFLPLVDAGSIKPRSITRSLADQPWLPVSRFLVALPPVRDLLLFAKHLFVAAVAAIAVPVRSRREHRSAAVASHSQERSHPPPPTKTTIRYWWPCWRREKAPPSWRSGLGRSCSFIRGRIPVFRTKTIRGAGIGSLGGNPS